MTINLKRAYVAPDKSDGKRFLVDRLWPRGISKEKADLTGGWLKDIAPSNELREWFGHIDDKFPEFEKKYKEELKGDLQQKDLAILKEAAAKGTITLVYGAKNELHNNAVVIKGVLLNK